MTQPSTTPPDDQSGFLDSPGVRLRELRESRGIEIERITAQLHLARDVVEALEQDRYAELPSPVFVAGYLKNYARLLGTDPEPILRAYRSIAPVQETQVARPASDPSRQTPARGGGSRAWLIGLLLIGVAVVAFAFWWQGRGDFRSGEAALEPADRAGELVDVRPGSAAPPREGLPDDGLETGSDADGESDVAPIDSFGSAVSVPPDAIPLRGMEPATGARPADAATNANDTVAEDAAATIPATSLPTGPRPARPSPPAELAEAREIALQFSGTSWVDVRDATGKVVLNGEMRDGDRRVLEGEPPFKLVIGNAAATKLTVGGDAFDLGSRARGNVARFSLDSSTPLDPNPSLDTE